MDRRVSMPLPRQIVNFDNLVYISTTNQSGTPGLSTNQSGTCPGSRRIRTEPGSQPPPIGRGRPGAGRRARPRAGTGGGRRRGPHSPPRAARPPGWGARGVSCAAAAGAARPIR
eukprot:55660-Prorocentrum_minimum.AAC.1